VRGLRVPTLPSGHQHVRLSADESPHWVADVLVEPQPPAAAGQPLRVLTMPHQRRISREKTMTPATGQQEQ
jgi:hypothetical protein